MVRREGFDPIDPYYPLESDPQWWAVHDVPVPYRSVWLDAYWEPKPAEKQSIPTTT